MLHILCGQFIYKELCKPAYVLYNLVPTMNKKKKNNWCGLNNNYVIIYSVF